MQESGSLTQKSLLQRNTFISWWTSSPRSWPTSLTWVCSCFLTSLSILISRTVSRRCPCSELSPRPGPPYLESPRYRCDPLSPPPACSLVFVGTLELSTITITTCRTISSVRGILPCLSRTRSSPHLQEHHPPQRPLQISVSVGLVFTPRLGRVVAFSLTTSSLCLL